MVKSTSIKLFAGELAPNQTLIENTASIKLFSG